MLKAAKTITHIMSSILNLIRPSAEFQKTLTCLILREFNRYWGQKKSGMRIGIKFDLIIDFLKLNRSFPKSSDLYF